MVYAVQGWMQSEQKTILAGPLLGAEEVEALSTNEDDSVEGQEEEEEIEVELSETEGMEGSGKLGDKERGEVAREGEEGDEREHEEPWRIGEDDAKTFW